MVSEAVQHAEASSASRSGFWTSSLLHFGLGTKAISIVTQCVNRKSLVPGIYLYCCISFSFFDKLFDKYTSSLKVIKTLVQLRVKLAKKRHDRVFYHNINPANPDPERVIEKELSGLFPPRNQWVSLGKKKRGTSSPIQRNNAILKIMIDRYKKSSEDIWPDWRRNLQIRADTLTLKMRKKKQQKFSPPSIIPAPKNVKENLFRPIAKFGLEDRIIIGSAASYIRERIDPVFEDCSYAFRAKNPKTNQCPTHHDAVTDLITYRKRHVGKMLYVAECDIQKFFDILNHDEIVKAFYKILRDLKKRGENRLDSRALAVFRNYLKCYTYESVAQTAAKKVFEERGYTDAKLDEPKQERLRKFYKDPLKIRYGVPQGGALSPIIANIVLHQADQDILAAYGNAPREDLYYARYCDDMVIVHPDREVCVRLLRTYTDSLEAMKLLVHEPTEFKKYDENFYNMKSKSPYPWTAPKKDRSTVPWVSFVGYQVGHDGSLRIRKASIDKETEKQKKIAALTVRSIKKRNVVSERSAHQIIYRLKSKLSSMATGKRYKNSVGPCEDMCWSNGFKLLKDHPFQKSQTRKLDRERERAIKSVEHALKNHKVQLPKDQTPPTRKEKRNFNRHFGHPFSYHSAFGKKKA